MESLWRYPMTTRTYFIECSGNSLRNLLPTAAPAARGRDPRQHFMQRVDGIPLRMLLEEAGLQPQAKWLLAEGADSAHMSRSIPLDKALDDAMIALYQNGERLRPEQGYPVRLLLPGWEGNTSVKWLHSLKATEGPTHTKDETSKYTDPLPDGRALQFTFEMGVKSVIARPSSTMTLPRAGVYEISGIAWSGAGRIRRVEVSTDGGANWMDAALTGAERAESAWCAFDCRGNGRARRRCCKVVPPTRKGAVQPPRKELHRAGPRRTTAFTTIPSSVGPWARTGV